MWVLSVEPYYSCQRVREDDIHKKVPQLLMNHLVGEERYLCEHGVGGVLFDLLSLLCLSFGAAHRTRFAMRGM